MDLYDRIKNPMDDDKTIMELIDLYANNGYIAYNDIVKHNQNTKIDRKTIHDEFNKCILEECIKRYKENLEQMCKSTEKNEKYNQTRNKKIQELDEKIKAAKDKNKKFEEGYNKCKSAFEKEGYIPLSYHYAMEKESRIVKITKDYNLTEQDLNDYFKYDNTKYNDACDEKENYIKKYPDYVGFHRIVKKYSPEDIIKINNNLKVSNKKDKEVISNFMDFMENRHNFWNKGIMGYHIKNRNFNSGSGEKFKSEAKLYINSDFDQVYKIANLLWKKSEDRGLDYYFKVNYPMVDEPNRADKLVIFSPLKDINSYIEIIDEIQKEHPEFVFENPGLIVGKLNNNVGIGMDSEDTSYNHRRADVLNDIFKEYFKNFEQSKIKDIVKKDKGIITKIKAKIKEKLTKNKISEEKFCMDSDKEEEFKKITRKKQKLENKDSKENKDSNVKKENKENKDSSVKKENKENKDSNVKKENKEKKDNNVSKENKENKEIKDNKEKSLSENLSELKQLIKSMAIDYSNGGKEFLSNEDKLKALLGTLYQQRAEKLNIKESFAEKRMNERRLDAMVSNVVRSAQTIQQYNKMGGASQKDIEEFNFSINELNKYFSDNNEVSKKGNDKYKSKDTGKDKAKKITKKDEELEK